MTFKNLIEDLIKYWKERQVSYENIAEKNRDVNQKNYEKYTYKAIATRDCWKELSNSIKHSSSPLTPFGESIKLLRDLADLQNGAPLEQHRDEWEDTMEKVYSFLESWEQKSTIQNGFEEKEFCDCGRSDKVVHCMICDAPMK